MTEVRDHFFLNHDAQPTLDLFRAHDPLGRLLRVGGTAKALASAAAAQVLRPRLGPLQAEPATLTIPFLLLRTAIPQQPIAVAGTLRTFHRMVNHVGAVLPPGVWFAMDFPPLQIVRLDMVAEPTILAACPWHDGQEPSVSAGNEAHVVATAQFAVGDIQESTVANKLTQKQPGVDVDRVIRSVTVVEFAVKGHSTIGTDGNAVEQLFEVGTVILVVAEGNTRRSVRHGWRPVACHSPRRR